MCHPLSALLPLSFFRSRILFFALYTVHHRIGSLSTRDPPPSPLPYGPIVVFSPSLPTLFPAVTILPDAPPPQFSVSLEQRERVTIYSGDLRDRGSRPPCPRALTSLSLSLPPPSRSSSECCPLDRPSLRLLSAPHRGSYHPFFSFLYLIAALFMPGSG